MVTNSKRETNCNKNKISHESSCIKNVCNLVINQIIQEFLTRNSAKTPSCITIGSAASLAPVLTLLTVVTNNKKQRKLQAYNCNVFKENVKSSGNLHIFPQYYQLDRIVRDVLRVLRCCKRGILLILQPIFLQYFYFILLH